MADEWLPSVKDEERFSELGILPREIVRSYGIIRLLRNVMAQEEDSNL